MKKSFYLLRVPLLSSVLFVMMMGSRVLINNYRLVVLNQKADEAQKKQEVVRVEIATDYSLMPEISETNYKISGPKMLRQWQARRWRRSASINLIENKLLRYNFLRELGLPTANILYGAFTHRSIGPWPVLDVEDLARAITNFTTAASDATSGGGGLVIKPISGYDSDGVLVISKEELAHDLTKVIKEHALDVSFARRKYVWNPSGRSHNFFGVMVEELFGNGNNNNNNNNIHSHNSSTSISIGGSSDSGSGTGTSSTNDQIEGVWEIQLDVAVGITKSTRGGKGARRYVTGAKVLRIGEGSECAAVMDLCGPGHVTCRRRGYKNRHIREQQKNQCGLGGMSLCKSRRKLLKRFLSRLEPMAFKVADAVKADMMRVDFFVSVSPSSSHNDGEDKIVINEATYPSYAEISKCTLWGLGRVYKKQSALVKFVDSNVDFDRWLTRMGIRPQDVVEESDINLPHVFTLPDSMYDNAENDYFHIPEELAQKNGSMYYDKAYSAKNGTSFRNWLELNENDTTAQQQRGSNSKKGSWTQMKEVHK